MAITIPPRPPPPRSLQSAPSRQCPTAPHTALPAPLPRRRFHPSCALLVTLTVLLCISPRPSAAQSAPAPYHAPATAALKRPRLSVMFSHTRSPPAGWETHNASLLTGSTARIARLPSPPLPPALANLLYAYKMRYSFTTRTRGLHTLRIALVERSGCKPGRRRSQFLVNRVRSQSVDVAALVGCLVPYYVDVVFHVRASGKVVLLMHKLLNSRKWPIISNFRLYTRLAPPLVLSPGSPSLSPSLSPSPTASPAPSVSASPPPPTVDSLFVDVGPDTLYTPGRATLLTSSSELDLTSVPASLQPSTFSTARTATSLKFSFTLLPATYDITLGFAEYDVANCNHDATRAFNIFVDGTLHFEAFNIFAAAAGCHRAVVRTVSRITIDILNPQPLVLDLQSVSGDAVISLIRIEPSSKQCVPISGEATLRIDHLAHAVPGIYPSSGEPFFVDADGDGKRAVTIDGGASHTHFFLKGTPGKIRSYTWTDVTTGDRISTQARFRRDFLRGTTRLRLTVVDDVCSTHSADTSVTVTGSTQQGTFCYFYRGLDALPAPASLYNADSARPEFAAVVPSLDMRFPPFGFDKTDFVARCLFFIDFAADSPGVSVSIDTGGSGTAILYRGAQIAYDTESSTSAASIPVTQGLEPFELLFQQRTASPTPGLRIVVGGTVPRAARVLHDRSEMLPILTSISPNSGRIAGGGRLRLKGPNLYPPLQVNFGGITVNTTADSTSTTVYVIVPWVADVRTVDVSAVTAAGAKSNALQYVYGVDCDPVKFNTFDLKDPNGAQLNLQAPTAVATWYDGSLYVGTYSGYMRVVHYDLSTLRVRTVCSSEQLTDERYHKENGALSERTILGVTFDPRDKTPRPYVSVSTLFWERQGGIEASNERKWSNGAVERMIPVTGGTLLETHLSVCLEHDRTIVSGLPVSDGDHAVNELVFTQDGDLLLTVGSFTNAGLPWAGAGGTWETLLSGSVLVARLSKGDAFNGNIQYTSPGNLRRARVKSGDVELYATGLRNMFSMKMARNGMIYGVDMGTNCGFGNVSSHCGEYVEAEAALRNSDSFVPFPGSAIVGKGDCKYSSDRWDKLVLLQEGAFYGHSNLQRGVLTDKPGECTWIDPETGLSPPPALASAPGNYVHRIARLKSATTAMAEYGSNLFCGRMRGDLVLGLYKGFGISRARMTQTGRVDGTPERFEDGGGLRVEENVLGDLIFAKLDKLGFSVLRPRITKKIGLFAVNVLPVRHGAAGGTLITIGGWGFEDGVVVRIGGRMCPIVTREVTRIVCRVPAAKVTSLIRSVSVKLVLGGNRSVLSRAVLYMNV